MHRQRGADRRREQRLVSAERRRGERRTGIDVEEISEDQARRVLARELKETALSPMEQALFELVHAYGVARTATSHQSTGPSRLRLATAGR